MIVVIDVIAATVIVVGMRRVAGYHRHQMIPIGRLRQLILQLALDVRHGHIVTACGRGAARRGHRAGHVHRQLVITAAAAAAARGDALLRLDAGHVGHLGSRFSLSLSPTHCLSLSISLSLTSVLCLLHSLQLQIEYSFNLTLMNFN